MRIAVTTEVSTKHRNASVINALENRGHKIFNVAMTNDVKNFELSYIHTSFMTAFLLEIDAVDFVVGGCGTGQGYAIATNMYPNVFCGLIYDPLEAWLFPQINDGKAISIPLNKQFGWAGEQNLKLIFDALFSAPAGRGYPFERCEPQKIFREKLKEISDVTHKASFVEIIRHLDPSILNECTKSEAFMNLVMNTPSGNPSRELFLKNSTT